MLLFVRVELDRTRGGNKYRVTTARRESEHLAAIARDRAEEEAKRATEAASRAKAATAAANDATERAMWVSAGVHKKPPGLEEINEVERTLDSTTGATKSLFSLTGVSSKGGASAYRTRCSIVLHWKLDLGLSFCSDKLLGMLILTMTLRIQSWSFQPKLRQRL